MAKQVRQQSPIFVKTYDFLLWLIPLTLKFPKSQRFLLAERLSGMALDFYDVIMEAVMERQGRQERLREADKFWCSRFVLRLETRFLYLGKLQKLVLVLNLLEPVRLREVGLIFVRTQIRKNADG